MKSLLLCLVFLSNMIAQTAPVVSERSVPEKADANVPKVYEFSGEDVRVVLRTLAREAQMNLVLSDIVKGTVNLRLVDKTARNIIEIIIQANGWAVTEIDSIYFIGAPDGVLAREAELIAHRTKIMFDAYVARGFMRAEAMDLIRNVPGGAQLGRPAAAEATAKAKVRNR